MPGPGPNAPLRLPPKCNRCQVNRVAWTSPRVDFCYDCLPGGPFATPPCVRCGSHEDYFSQGLCSRCHPRSPEHIGSCKGCLAWGVYRLRNWTCRSCRWWHTHYPEGTCDFCGRLTRIGEQQACRLCLEQGRMVQEPGRASTWRERPRTANSSSSPTWSSSDDVHHYPNQAHRRDATRTACPTSRAPGSTMKPGNSSRASRWPLTPRSSDSASWSRTATRPATGRPSSTITPSATAGACDNATP
jgi:hypothetical protein